MTDTHIKDVVSHTLGIGLKDDLYDPLIPKDHVIPHKVVRRGYTTAEDNQTSVFIPVYQGDNPKGSLNYQLGQVVIDGLAPRPKGAHNFQVTFALDADGVFSGEVLYQQENKVVPIKLDRGQGSMTEKKRIALADQVAAGLIGPGGTAPEAKMPSSTPADPIDQVISEAQKLLPSLQANRQRELSELLSQLEQARATNDTRSIPSLVTQLTMFVLRNK